jgi:hypothetical protein
MITIEDVAVDKQKRFIAVSTEFLPLVFSEERVYYINDTDVGEDEPYDIVCETECPKKAHLVVEALNHTYHK